MRRLFLVFCFMSFASTAFGQSKACPFAEDQTGFVPITATVTSTNAFSTAISVTTFTISVTKFPAGGSAPSSISFSPTASGGTHDMTAITNGYSYRLEVPATDSDTPGLVRWEWTQATVYSSYFECWVYPVATANVFNNGDWATIPTNWSALRISSGGFVGLNFSDVNGPYTGDAYARLGSPVGATISSDVQSTKVARVGVARTYTIGPFVDATGAYMSGTPTCTIAKDAVVTGASPAVTNPPAALSVYGQSRLAVTAAEMTGVTSEINIHCFVSTVPYDLNIQVQ